MATPLKLMTFNILNGGGDETRFRGVLDVIRQASPDLLVLQECLDWEEDGPRMAAVAEALGVPLEAAHARLGRSRPRGSGKAYHLGLFSKSPIQACQTYNDPAFLGHSIAHLKLDWGGQSLNVLAAHFDSKNENLRFVEARYLRSLIDAADFKTGLYALAGDLNALSSQDPYPVDLESLLRQSMTTKYHLPPRFEVMEELAEFGWLDGLYLKPPSRWITAPRDRGGVHIDYRTDYLLFSPKLAERVGQVEVVPIAQESDHFPVQAVLF
jgi:exodeoxyribonuclease-3